MPSKENIMSINKIIGVKREREKKGRYSGKGAVVGALSTVCMSLTMRERVYLDHSTTWLRKACTKPDFFPFLMPGRDEFLSL